MSQGAVYLTVEQTDAPMKRATKVEGVTPARWVIRFGDRAAATEWQNAKRRNVVEVITEASMDVLPPDVENPKAKASKATRKGME